MTCSRSRTRRPVNKKQGPCACEGHTARGWCGGCPLLPSAYLTQGYASTNADVCNATPGQISRSAAVSPRAHAHAAYTLYLLGGPHTRTQAHGVARPLDVHEGIHQEGVHLRQHRHPRVSSVDVRPALGAARLAVAAGQRLRRRRPGSPPPRTTPRPPSACKWAHVCVSGADPAASTQICGSMECHTDHAP